MEVTQQFLEEQLDKHFKLTQKHVSAQFDAQFERLKVYMDHRLETEFERMFERMFERLVKYVDLRLEQQTQYLIKVLTEGYQKFNMEAIEAHQVWVREHFKEWMMPYEIRLSRLEAQQRSADKFA